MSADLAVYILWLVWMVSWAVAAAVWSSPSARRAGWRREMPSRVAVILGAVLLFGLYSPRHMGLLRLWHFGEGTAWVFTGIAALGFAFAWWARIHLGTLWSGTVTRKQGHHIIESGPYGLVRHPIYTGIILASLATAIEIGTVAALLGAAIMTLGWYLKARLEEGFLRTELGAAAYDGYARRTAMLVPFLRF